MGMRLSMGIAPSLRQVSVLANECMQYFCIVHPDQKAKGNKKNKKVTYRQTGVFDAGKNVFSQLEYHHDHRLQAAGFHQGRHLRCGWGRVSINYYKLFSIVFFFYYTLCSECSDTWPRPSLGPGWPSSRTGQGSTWSTDGLILTPLCYFSQTCEYIYE